VEEMSSICRVPQCGRPRACRGRQWYVAECRHEQGTGRQRQEVEEEERCHAMPGKDAEARGVQIAFIRGVQQRVRGGGVAWRNVQ